MSDSNSVAKGLMSSKDSFQAKIFPILTFLHVICASQQRWKCWFAHQSNFYTFYSILSKIWIDVSKIKFNIKEWNESDYNVISPFNLVYPTPRLTYINWKRNDTDRFCGFNKNYHYGVELEFFISKMTIQIVRNKLFKFSCEISVEKYIEKHYTVSTRRKLSNANGQNQR